AHGGGPFRDWGAHLMDQAVQLFGPHPELIFADFQYRWPQVDVETAAVCWMRFQSGVRYRVEVGGISHTPRPRWYVRGSRGTLTIWGLDPQEAALHRGEVIGGRGAMPAEAVRLEGPAAEEGPLPIVPGDYTRFYPNVLAAVRGEAPLLVPPEEVRDVLAVMDAAIRSAAEGVTVRLGA
ncbi:MAG TPA: Gfo/Idh/MocA family oxidoreductase, partial [Limnochordia bacterium]